MARGRGWVYRAGPLMGFLMLMDMSLVDGFWFCEGILSGGKEGVSFRGTTGGRCGRNGRSGVSFGGTGGDTTKRFVLEKLTAVLDGG